MKIFNVILLLLFIFWAVVGFVLGGFWGGVCSGIFTTWAGFVATGFLIDYQIKNKKL